VHLARGGSELAMMLAVDGDMRIVGADRNARHVLRLQQADLELGMVLSTLFERAPELFRRSSTAQSVQLILRQNGAAWQADVTVPRETMRPRITPAPISTQVRAKPSSIHSGGLSPQVAGHIRDYIESHLAENIRLDQLAALAGLSMSHFARAFKQTMGTPTRRYIIKRRIIRAQQLLADPTLSLSQIALRLGFADHSHFTRQFRLETGTTPRIARQMR
jgi:AraC-like DNA-binding protein